MMAEALDDYDPAQCEEGFALWMEATQRWTAVADAATTVGPSFSRDVR